MESFNEAWVIICDYCKERITDVAYKTWISRIEPIDLDFTEGTAILTVPNEFHRQTLTRCYLSLLNEAFEAVFGSAFNVCLMVPSEMPQKEHEEVEDTEKVNNTEFTFESFIVGSSNKFAHAASLAVATNPAGAYNPLFIYGNSGLGKTHLLYAIGNEIKKNNNKMDILYVKGDDFTNDLIESIRLAKTREFRQKYRQTDVLLVDDVQFIAGKESTQEEFFHTFNTLFESNKQIIFTSDRPPKEIKTLEERLKSRFEMGLLADIQPPDIETRIAIVKRKGEILNFPISDEICEYIATKLKTNIRQLEGVVKKMKAKSLLNGEKCSISSAQDVISDILNNNLPPEMTVEKIIDEVARTFGITSAEIRSTKNRRANISNARHIAIYIVRQLTQLSMIAIGNEFGGRHYSTIVYNIQQVEQNMGKNQKMKETVEDIIKNIRDR
ncbi:MAG: chromosomal replication initiator protein DnaA [Bacillota bacterium]|nr:chromosomal replication initiator protein DnaA [Bacillota bacterium]